MRLRYLMNQQDSSPGASSAAGSAQASPSGTGATQAQGTAAGAQGDQEQSLIDRIADGVNNKVFANLRRAGVLGEDNRRVVGPRPGTQQTTATAAQASDAGAQGGTPDVRSVMQRNRAFDRAIGGYDLTDKQIARMERLFDLEEPEDVAGWVRSYAEDSRFTSRGAAGANGSTTQQQQAAAAAPASLPGSNVAPASPVVTEDTPLMQMRPEDRAALIKQKGLAWYKATLRKQLKGVKVKVR